MKKSLYSILAVAAILACTGCESRLDIEQKGVTAIENFYKTEADAEAALAAAYAGFATNVTGRGAGFIYTPMNLMLNYGADDMYGAGSNYGDNDDCAKLNEYRYDSGLGIIKEFYSGIFQSVYTANLVIDYFKNGLPDGSNSARLKAIVAEARTIRAYDYFLLTALWGNPPMVDHVLGGDALPFNSDADPDYQMDQTALFKWVANECKEAANDLDERRSQTDKDGAVKCTKGFANALAGKALLFAKDYAGAKAELKKVIDSDKYALVPGSRFSELFHIEGDGNEEKIFESNNEYNAGIGAWGGPNQRSSWMDANRENWRADHFKADPRNVYCGGADGWGGLGVPQWFGDEFFANDGHSPRFDATLKHIDDAVYNMEYVDASLNAMTLDEKKASDKIGISDPQEGLYGQSFWLPFKQMVKGNDCNASYGNNVRLNNIMVMRYAEVLLLYAEACEQSGDNGQAKWAVNQIRNRAGLADAPTVDMTVIKKEKSYELWHEGCRWLDIVRWGDTDRIKNNGRDVPKLFDKIHRPVKATDESVKWENGTEANSRFYTAITHGSLDAGATVGFVDGKHDHYPFPQSVIEKNPNLKQWGGWAAE